MPSSIAFTTPTPVQTTPVVTSSVIGSAQLLAATTPRRKMSPGLQSASNLATTSVSPRAAAVDDALATRIYVKSHVLPDELFNLLAAG